MFKPMWVTQLDIDTGSITNQATASGTGVSGLVTDLSGATISDDISNGNNRSSVMF